MIKTEKWCGHYIRFVEQDGEWLAILKDVCDALNLRSKDVSQRLEPNMMERILVEVSKDDSNDVRSKGKNKTRWMIAVNEIGIYEALFASRRLEARKFRHWTANVMQKLRKKVGIEGYEVMKMTDKDIQDKINNILDTLYWDEETGKLMQSITVQGGDAEQIPFED